MVKQKEETNSAVKEAPAPRSSRLEKFIQEEIKFVKGRFRCYETPGGSTRVMVRKYKGVPMFDKWMFDNYVYEIPLYVARHLNGVDVTAHAINGKVGSCSYGVHGFKMGGPNDLKPSVESWGPDGQPGIPVCNTEVQKRVRRYGFESLEFDAE